MLLLYPFAVLPTIVISLLHFEPPFLGVLHTWKITYWPLLSFNQLIYLRFKKSQVLDMDPCLHHHIFKAYLPPLLWWYLPPFPVNIGESHSLVVAQIHFNPFRRKWRQISATGRSMTDFLSFRKSVHWKNAGDSVGNRTRAENLEGEGSTTGPQGCEYETEPTNRVL